MSDSEECEIEIKLEGTTFTRLTQIVRNQYLKFLKKQLANNLLTCCREEDLNGENDRLEVLVQKCAKNLEDLAIQEATLTQLYQRAMVKTIDTVRRCTKECRLLEEMQMILNLSEPNGVKYNTATKATQTENYDQPTLTLDERIDLFQKHLNPTQITESRNSAIDDFNDNKSNREHRKRHSNSRKNECNKKRLGRMSTTPVWHSPTPPPKLPSRPKYKTIDTLCSNKPTNQAPEEELAGDEVAKELEKLFMEQETDLEEIFGISLQNCTANCDTKETPEEETFVKTTAIQNAITCAGVEKLTKNTCTIETCNSTPSHQNNQIYRQPVNDLRHSLWPCECFMQKRRLSATLTRLIEEDLRWFDILKIQFSVLFGDENTHDDFAPCSPSLELDEVLTSSCMRRISPWVVKHLMKPLQDGLIGNRFLFKKLAKKLAYHIITENQYPNEVVIKNAVENFFCLHSAVMTADDLNNIDATTIVDSE